MALHETQEPGGRGPGGAVDGTQVLEPDDAVHMVRDGPSILSMMGGCSFRMFLGGFGRSRIGRNNSRTHHSQYDTFDKVGRAMISQWPRIVLCGLRWVRNTAQMRGCCLRVSTCLTHPRRMRPLKGGKSLKRIRTHTEYGRRRLLEQGDCESGSMRLLKANLGIWRIALARV